MKRTVLLILGLAAAAAAHPKTVSDPRDAPEKASDPDDRMICKRFAETGSLVNFRRVCATKKQWSISRSDLRQTSDLNSCANLAETGRC